MIVYMTFNDTEEYSLRLIAILCCDICSQITVAHVTLTKAVLSTVKIFAVYNNTNFDNCFFYFETFKEDYMNTTRLLQYKEKHRRQRPLLIKRLMPNTAFYEVWNSVMTVVEFYSVEGEIR